MIVAYTGTSDFQEFSKDDLAKAGIEDGKDLRFAQSEPTEVPDEVGEALVSNKGIFGDFSFKNLDEVDEGETDEETEENQRQVAKKAAKKTAKKAASSSDAGGPETSGSNAKAQSSGDTGATTGTTAGGTTAGGSTRGATR